jgi:hypothetical protein
VELAAEDEAWSLVPKTEDLIAPDDLERTEEKDLHSAPLRTTVYLRALGRRLDATEHSSGEWGTSIRYSRTA